MNLPQMRLFIRERRALARVAPHLVRPLAFVVPTYRGHRRVRARDANGAADQRRSSRATVTTGSRIPACTCQLAKSCRSRRVSAAQPGDRTRGCNGRRGVARLSDAQHRSHDVLVRALGGSQRGAATANYVKAVRLVRDESRVVGRDGRGSTDVATHSRFVARHDAERDRAVGDVVAARPRADRDSRRRRCSRAP